jgi:SAM-dependent methyltransferase
MQDFLVRLLGWRALMLHGDPCVWDRYRWLRPRLRGGGRATLDAGAGNGGFTIFAAKQGNECLGLSFDAGEMTAAERRAAICHADRAQFEIRDLRELDSENALMGRFDEVVCLEVAEHILDDGKLFRDLAATLRPGGRLLLTTPFISHRPLFREHLSATEDGGHVRWGYSEARLRELSEQASLEPIEIGYVSGVVSQRLTNLQRRVSMIHRLLGWAVVLPLRVLRPLDAPLTAALRYPHLSIALTARRPQP